ncbi:MAG: hypothetical protein Q9M82_00415 [Mariprofundus sp.]|nr:hypothetical protein [Mariprofundus sp.]
MDIYFWAIAIGLGLPLWWFAYIATKRMRIGKNLEREALAKHNLERFKQEQTKQEQAKQILAQQDQAASAQETDSNEKKY